jgi:hypothetical protein
MRVSVMVLHENVDGSQESAELAIQLSRPLSLRGAGIPDPLHLGTLGDHMYGCQNCNRSRLIRGLAPSLGATAAQRRRCTSALTSSPH